METVCGGGDDQGRSGRFSLKGTKRYRQLTQAALRRVTVKSEHEEPEWLPIAEDSTGDLAEGLAALVTAVLGLFDVVKGQVHFESHLFQQEAYHIEGPTKSR